MMLNYLGISKFSFALTDVCTFHFNYRTFCFYRPFLGREESLNEAILETISTLRTLLRNHNKTYNGSKILFFPPIGLVRYIHIRPVFSQGSIPLFSPYILRTPRVCLASCNTLPCLL